MHKILYVESAYPEYRLLDFTLSHYSCELYHAINYFEAIEKVKEIEFDLIIISMELPDINAIELLSVFKSDEILENIPVILLGIDNSEEIIEAAKLAGCSKYFLKPIDLITFPDEIKKIISSPKTNPNILNKQIVESFKNKLEENKNLKDKLEKNEMKFSKILSNLTDSIIITNSKFEIKYFNNRLSEFQIFQEYYNKTNNFFEIFELLDNEVIKIKEKLLNNNSIKNIELKLSHEKEHFFFANFSKLDDDFLISLRDFTDKIEFDNKYAHIDKMATVGKITAGIVHEIKNPLTAIKNYIEILKFSDGISKENIDILSKIEYGFNKIDILSKSLMSFSRQSNEKMYPTNINNTIMEVLDFSGYEIKRGNVNVNIELAKDIPLILAVKSEIEQVLLNLLINANHSLKNIKNPEITIKTFVKNNQVCISIIDNGCGIPNNVLDKIFEPFFTTKDNNEGTGLGLSMVKTILNRHNAKIYVDTGLKGTTFTIEINPFELENRVAED